MAEPLRCVPGESVITGWDFSTGAVKCLAFDLDGKAVFYRKIDVKDNENRNFRLVSR